MGDPRFNVVPYRDPYDTPLSPSFFNFTNPTLADLSNNNINTNTNNNIFPALPAPQQIHLGHGQVQDQVIHNNPFPGPMIHDEFVHMGNFFPNGGLGVGGSYGGFNFEVGGPSQLHTGEPSQPSIGNFGSQNYNNNNYNNNNNNNNNMLALTCWQDLPTPFSCTCCQVLREIIHTNGITFTKLEIHGRLGMICHAIQHYNINGLNRGSSSNLQYQMIDFGMSNIHEIKNFLVQYCVGQNSLGYIIMQDPMSAYYEALCTGLDWAEDLSDLVEGGQSGDDNIEQEAEDARIPRATLAEQRAANMTLHDLSDYFHLTIDEASKYVNLCPTVVKKICRRGNLKRWPYRKVKSIVKQITVLRKNLNSADAVSRTRTEAQIRRLEEEMINHCGGVAPTALTY